MGEAVTNAFSQALRARGWSDADWASFDRPLPVETLHFMVSVSVEEASDPDHIERALMLVAESAQDDCSDLGLIFVEGSVREVSRIPAALMHEGWEKGPAKVSPHKLRKPVPLNELPLGTKVDRYLIFFEAKGVNA